MAEMGFDPVAHAKEMRAGGFWVDRNYDEFLVAATKADPNKPALIVYRADRESPSRCTYAELADAVTRATRATRCSSARPSAT
jgi:cyclohexanecarboxylate-CoA ligase